MRTWIALIRGINVGGNNVLPMKELRAPLENLGFENARTYIQSGNCIFQSDRDDTSSFSEEIAGAIMAKLDFKPSVLILNESDLRLAIEKNPYPQGLEDPKSVHLFFLSEAASEPNIEALDQLRKASEDYEITNKVFYLYTPEGIGRSKLASQAEKKLGVTTTARNLRSAIKILELAS